MCGSGYGIGMGSFKEGKTPLPSVNGRRYLLIRFEFFKTDSFL
jgi:hypothetical protein